MENEEEKKEKKKRRLLWILLILLVMFILFVSGSIIKMYGIEGLFNINGRNRRWRNN